MITGEPRCLESGHVRFGGRPHGKGPVQQAPRRAAHPTQASKGLAGLVQHQVRRWTSWHRWTVLVMLGYALLAALAAYKRADNPTPDGLIPLTCNEIHHLFNVTIRPLSSLAHRLRWSTWRRRHQHRARTSHYQRRQAPAP